MTDRSGYVTKSFLGKCIFGLGATSREGQSCHKACGLVGNGSCIGTGSLFVEIKHSLNRQYDNEMARTVVNNEKKKRR